MATPEISAPKSPSPPTLSTAAASNSSSSSSSTNNKSLCNPLPPSPRVQQASAILAYEHYLRLPELSKLCASKNFPQWTNESILKPALQALEVTFRLVSLSLSDTRPYSNHRQWKRRLDSLANHQIELIATISRQDSSSVPIADLAAAGGVLARGKSSQEVWKLNGTTATLVSHTSEASLLPRLASWEKSEDVASKILMQIECQMHGCPFTLGLGEPNLAGKPSLEYDLIVRPAELHALKKSPILDQQLKNNQESQTLFAIHHILELWVCAAREVLARISNRIDGAELEEAASDCWLLERIWELLLEVEDLHLLMDPDDFLRLKSQLCVRASTGSDAFCFRSRGLVEVTSLSKDLKHRVPQILRVEVDPSGGPRVQEAAMRLFRSRRMGGEEGDRVHLLQAFQAIEVAVKRFYFGYRQLISAVMGSLEANGNRGLGLWVESSDSLTQMYMDPPYFPSLDAAKTFLGELWQCQARSSN